MDNCLGLKKRGKSTAGDSLALAGAGGGAYWEISNGNRTEWSPIRSVIIRVITKSDDRAAGVRFVYHEYD